jgi:hypothetical protein
MNAAGDDMDGVASHPAADFPRAAVRPSADIELLTQLIDNGSNTDIVQSRDVLVLNGGLPPWHHCSIGGLNVKTLGIDHIVDTRTVVISDRR